MPERRASRDPKGRVPVYDTRFVEADVEAVAGAVRSGWVGGGRSVGAFERGWSSYCGMPCGVAVSNGTAALELALAALDLGPGDEVLCPTFTIVSCARAIVLSGATPVLVDAEPRTFNLDLEAAARRIGPRTRAVLAVHTYGYPVDARALGKLAKAHGLEVIEDAAEAHGVETLDEQGHWIRCGGLGDLSTFSFYANKALTAGEGGMILCRDAAIAERLRAHRNLYLDGARRFRHEDVGANYRWTNLQAALALSQLARIDSILASKRRVGEAYRARLGDLAEIEMQVVEPWARPVPWMNGLVLRDDVPLDAEGLARALDDRGIETRPFFLGMHEQPVFARRGLFVGERHPVAERLARRGLYLPSAPDLDDATIDRVCEAVCDAVRGATSKAARG